jgi:hypothetical protein
MSTMMRIQAQTGTFNPLVDRTADRALPVVHPALTSRGDAIRQESDRRPAIGESQLRDWHTDNLGRLPGLKFMRTLWVCTVAGGPQQYAATKPAALFSAWKRRIAN